MTQWTSIEQALPGDWDLVVALDTEQNYYLVEWDEDRQCFWDQGTRYLKSEFSFWMSVAEPPVEVSELDTLLLAS